MMLTDSSETSVDENSPDRSKSGWKRERRSSIIWFLQGMEQPVFLHRWALYDSRLDFKKG